MAQLNPFDLVVLLTLSNTVQNAIIGNDTSVTGGTISFIGQKPAPETMRHEELVARLDQIARELAALCAERTERTERAECAAQSNLPYQETA